MAFTHGSAISLNSCVFFPKVSWFTHSTPSLHTCVLSSRPCSFLHTCVVFPATILTPVLFSQLLFYFYQKHCVLPLICALSSSCVPIPAITHHHSYNFSPQLRFSSKLCALSHSCGLSTTALILTQYCGLFITTILSPRSCSLSPENVVSPLQLWSFSHRCYIFFTDMPFFILNKPRHLCNSLSQHLCTPFRDCAFSTSVLSFSQLWSFS